MKIRPNENGPSAEILTLYISFTKHMYMISINFNGATYWLNNSIKPVKQAYLGAKLGIQTRSDKKIFLSLSTLIFDIFLFLLVIFSFFASQLCFVKEIEATIFRKCISGCTFGRTLKVSKSQKHFFLKLYYP